MLIFICCGKPGSRGFDGINALNYSPLRIPLRKHLMTQETATDLIAYIMAILLDIKV
mgnify:CR=1